MRLVSSTGIGRDHVIGSAGVLDARTLPARSTATHSEAEGHEIPVSWVIRSMFSGAQAEALVGVPKYTSPALPTARHRDDRGHETAARRVRGSTDTVVFHEFATGAVLDKTLPRSSTATHSEIDSHVSAVRERSIASAWIAGDQVSIAASDALAAIPAAHSATAKPKTARRARDRIDVAPTVVPPQ
jgi:hypothetical protein